MHMSSFVQFWVFWMMNYYLVFYFPPLNMNERLLSFVFLFVLFVLFIFLLVIKLTNYLLDYREKMRGKEEETNEERKKESPRSIISLLFEVCN